MIDSLADLPLDQEKEAPRSPAYFQSIAGDGLAQFARPPARQNQPTGETALR